MKSNALTKKGFTRAAAAFALVAALLSGALMTGCASQDSGASSSDSSAAAASSPESSAAASDAAGKVTVTLTSPAADDAVTYEGDADIEDGATVLDVLEGTGLEMVIEDSEYGAYVSSIEGLANEGMLGWVFTVNGQQINVSADQQTLVDGDSVEWSYIDMAA